MEVRVPFLDLNYNTEEGFREAVRLSYDYTVDELRHLRKTIKRDLNLLTSQLDVPFYGKLPAEERSWMIRIHGEALEKMNIIIKIRNQIRNTILFIRRELRGCTHPIEHRYISYPMDHKWNIETTLCLN